jgi:BON domain
MEVPMIGAGLTKLALAAAAGAGVAYLFDRDRGRARRARLRDQARAKLRREVRDLERHARHERGRVEGLVHRATHRHPTPPENDHVIVDKIRSEVLGRMPDVAHHISVDAAKGVVTLRGQLDDREAIARLEGAVRRVDGVREVVNLLHLPGEPPPNKEAALRTGE